MESWRPLGVAPGADALAPEQPRLQPEHLLPDDVLSSMELPAASSSSAATSAASSASPHAAPRARDEEAEVEDVEIDWSESEHEVKRAKGGVRYKS